MQPFTQGHRGFDSLAELALDSRWSWNHTADKNINESLEDLNRTFHRLRQRSGIDEELFDVMSGFETLKLEEK
jgi:F-type H+-transporting ATPase subunit gamma